MPTTFLRLPRPRSARLVAVLTCAAPLLAACGEGPTEVGGPPDEVQAGPRTLDLLDPAASAGALPDWNAPQPSSASGVVIRSIRGDYSRICNLNTGLAFDGSHLILSCWYHDVLDVLDLTGTLVSTVRVDGPYLGYGALAWDAGRGTLWACAAHTTVVQIDLASGAVLSSFPVPDECSDGLAYDGSDDTFYTSGDVKTDVHHWESDGTPIDVHPIGGLFDGGNSGIATGGGKIYLGAPNFTPAIWEVERDFSAATRFATLPRRVEDMECDDLTFAPFAAMWQGDAFDRWISAIHIPSDACPFGGGGSSGDTTPPEIAFTADCAALWPPDHEMRTVLSGISASDDTDDAPALSIEVTSNEPVDGEGDGSTEPDWEIVDRGDGTFDVRLRAERAAGGNGRTYTVVMRATDAAGNLAEVEHACVVPHDQADPDARD